MITRRVSRLTATLMLVALAMQACSSGAGPTAPVSGVASPPVPVTLAPTTPAPSPLVASIEPPTAIPGTNDAIPASYIEAAIADAASRAGVGPADVIVVSAQSRDWPSGALGCPVMGFMYTDMITPGYRIVVEAGGQSYDYRAAARGPGEIRLCDKPLGPG